VFAPAAGTCFNLPKSAYQNEAASMLHPISWSLALPYYAGALLFGYLLGAIPFGLVLTRMTGAGDLRAIGSGNIGATNVLRTGRKGLAALTLLLDALKGTVAVIVADRFGGQDLAVLAALGAFLGHLFPVWLGFRGGKGVATYIGVLLALVWQAAAAFCIVWLLVAFVSRYSSLSALIASVVAPLLLWWDGYLQEAQLFLLLTVLLWYRHRGNVARLVAGTETKIGRSTSP
jgi:acyl phosphate:glycerol-3-phosphate acyltransferase